MFDNAEGVYCDKCHPKASETEIHPEHLSASVCSEVMVTDVRPRVNHSDLSGTAVQVVGVGRSTPVFELVSISFSDGISVAARLLIHNQRLFNQRSPPHLPQHAPLPPPAPSAATAEGGALILSK